MMELACHAVDRTRWSDLAALFESRGGPKNCWCMVWRAQGSEARASKGPERREALARRVSDGTPIGLLGYLEGKPVAWCSIAPRSTYRALGGITKEGEDERAIWSLVCLFIKRPLRGQGLSSQMLHQAVEYARANGAKIVESYPVDPDSPSYRFMGFVPAFEAMGFRHMGRVGSRRHIMRLEL